jgi:hypothetical protein
MRLDQLKATRLNGVGQTLCHALDGLRIGIQSQNLAPRCAGLQNERCVTPATQRGIDDPAARLNL